MKAVISLSAALGVTIWIRSELVQNIQPWEWQWVGWVGSTCGISMCIGYSFALMRVMKKRKSREHDDTS